MGKPERGEVVSLFVAFLLSPQAWEKWKQGPLLPWSRAVEPTPALLPLPFQLFSPMFVLAKSCCRLFRADSIRAKLENQDMESQRREPEGP